MTLSFDYRQRPAHVVFGAGRAAAATVEALETLGSTRALVVVSESQRSRTGIVDAIGERVAGTFTRVIEHVPHDVVDDAREAAAAADADAVVSIGGGSATGVAKAVALTTGLPIVAVPTTYAGSEMTDVWGITTDGVKRTGTDPAVLPRTVVYDPELFRALPRDFTVTSAFNALAHALEAFWGARANPISSVIAAEAVQVLIGGVRDAIEGSDPARSTERLLYGSFLAGTVFASAGSGIHHKICHLLGGAFALPHAPTHAVLITRVFALNAPYADAAREAVTAALGDDDAAAGLARLAREAGVPLSLRELGLSAQQLAAATEAVVDLLPVPNPAPLTSATVADLMMAAYEPQ